MRLIKALAAGVGALIGLLAVGLFCLWLWVNPNDYRVKIANAVKESTGRDLEAGDIHLSVFPWVALKLGPSTLGNPPGFDATPFLAFRRAALRVRLRPLLSRHLVIDRIDIDGLDLRLRRNADGVGNWENVGPGAAGAPGAPGASSAIAPPASTGPAADRMPARDSLRSLEGLRVTNGRVSFENLSISKLRLETGAFGGDGGVTPVTLSLQADRGVAGEDLTAELKFDAALDEPHRDLRFQALNAAGTLSLPGDGHPSHWELSVPSAAFNVTAQTVELDDFALSVLGAHFTGRVRGTQIVDSPSVSGTLTLEPLVLREFAPRLGFALPKTTDPRALAQLSANGEFHYDAKGVAVSALQAQLDDTHVKGRLALTREPRAVEFDLSLDAIKLDRYLNPDPATPATAPVPASAPGASWPTVNGTLTAASLQLALLQFENLRLTVAAKDHVLHLFPSLAQIDGGSYSGDITLDRSHAVPILSLDEHFSGVDLARLLAGTEYKGRVSGRGTLDVAASAHGSTPKSLMRTLNGRADFDLVDGALQGIDLDYQLGRAAALLHNDPAPHESNPRRTPFQTFKLSAQITDGMAVIRDLTIASSQLRVTGRGSVNLVDDGIDLNLLASLARSSGVSIADVPLRISGTFADPDVRPDMGALAKGQVRQKLQDLLDKNGLKGLFGK
jgi:AsmA protein